jgi:hypothetical protein
MIMIRGLVGALQKMHVAALMMATVVGCGRSGGDGGGLGPIPTECIDISGSWTVTESASLTCGGFLDTFVPSSLSGSGAVDLRQDGCELAYSVPGSGLERRGTIDGSFVWLSGSIAAVPGIEGVRIIENVLTIEGEVDGDDPNSFVLNGYGGLSVEFEGETSSCTVSSTAEFSR